MSFWTHLRSEFSKSDAQSDFKESEYKAKRENVYVFLRLPWALEKFMFYGFLQCADSFLYICAILPLRVLNMVARVFAKPFLIHVKYELVVLSFVLPYIVYTYLI